MIDQSQMTRADVVNTAGVLKTGAKRKGAGWLARLTSPFETLGEFAQLTRRSGRALWLMSMMVVLGLLAILLVVIQVIEYVAPFVYTIF